jgi:phosphoribosylaminoimidazolecarboxamide formyltransferase/IMP cyclohydrolase
MQQAGFVPIDLVVVNLYPFRETVARGAPFEEVIENIDIGGPAMIRAAAKNHGDVAVIVDPEDYGALLAALKANAGATTLDLRKRLAAKAYARTAAYDAAISNWFADTLADPAPTYRAVGGRLIEAQDAELGLKILRRHLKGVDAYFRMFERLRQLEEQYPPRSPLDDL